MKMEPRAAPRGKAVLLSLVVLLAMSCGGDSTGPAFTFSGGWVGSWEFGDPVYVEMGLEQAGPLVTGIFDSPMTRLPNAHLEGEIDELGRLVWTVLANCTGGGILSASGTLTMHADGERASGQAILDESTCDVPGSASVAILIVDRERLGH